MSKDNQPYIFISYAHKDKERIYPFISALKEKYEVWFDEGIHYGREWEEEIAAKLDECSIFMFAVTENSLDSKNCRDELTLARDTDKRFLNVVFSDDIELPRWFKLRYSRYQMCYYNRLPSAHAVVEDLGQNCEWFEDVKLPTVQSVEHEKAEDVSGEYVMIEQEISEKTADETQNLSISREKANNISAQSITPSPGQLKETIEKKQSENTSEDKRESDEIYESSLPRKYTRKQIIDAVEYAKKTDQEKRPFYTLNRYIRLYEDMTEKQISNLTKRAAYKITKENIVAMCGDPLSDSGLTGVLITEACLYCSSDKFYISNGEVVFDSEFPVIISKVASVKLLSGDRRIKISYDDSTSRIFDFGHYAPIVYYFLNRLTNDVKKEEKKAPPVKSVTTAKPLKSSSSQQLTRNDIINAVRCSNFKNSGKTGIEFTFLSQLKKNQINNIIQKIAPLVHKESIVAFCDETLLNNGKSGILITESKIYYSFSKQEDPVTLSKIKSVEMVDKEHIKITYNDSTTERKFYSTNTTRVYDFLDMLIV